MSNNLVTTIRASPRHAQLFSRLMNLRDGSSPELRHVESLLSSENHNAELCVWIGMRGHEPFGFVIVSPMQASEDAVGNVFVLELFTLPDAVHLAERLIAAARIDVQQRRAPSGVSLFCMTSDVSLVSPLTSAGFSLAPPLSSLFKPLKPLRMLTARRGLGRLGRLVSFGPDTLFHGALSVTHRALSSGLDFVDCSVEGPWLNALSQMLLASGEEQLMRRWSPAVLRARLNWPVLEPYSVMAAARGPSIVAVVVSRMFDAPTGERFSLILDAVHTPAGLDAICPLLTRHEKHALVQGADAMYALTPNHQPLVNVFHEMGYFSEIAPSLHHTFNWSTISSDRAALSRCRLSLLDFGEL